MSALKFNNGTQTAKYMTREMKNMDVIVSSFGSIVDLVFFSFSILFGHSAKSVCVFRDFGGCD